MTTTYRFWIVVGGVVVFGAGLLVGLVVSTGWEEAGDDPDPGPAVLEPVTTTVAAVPMSGWVDFSQDERPLAVLDSLEHPQFYATLKVGCIVGNEYPTDLEFAFDGLLAKYDDVGYASGHRWGFVIDDVLYPESRDPSPYITAELFGALTSADGLVVETDVMPGTGDNRALEYSEEGMRWEGETEWRPDPEIYLYRATYDLQVDNTALREVVDRCGLAEGSDW